MADGFDAVAAGVNQEGGEVVFVVLGPVAWCTVVAAVMQQTGGVKGDDLGMVGGLETPVALWIGVGLC